MRSIALSQQIEDKFYWNYAFCGESMKLGTHLSTSTQANLATVPVIIRL